MTGYLEALSESECAALLRECTVGRLLWAGADGLRVIPLAYGVDADGAIALLIDPSSATTEAVDGRPCLLEVDSIDPTTLTGWSVVVHGRARVWEGDFPQGLVRPWAPGSRTLGVRVVAERLTGRVVSGDD